MKEVIKKVVAVFVTATIVFSIFSIVPFAANTTFAVRSEKYEYDQGDEITAEVYLPKSCNLIASLDMTINYDSNKFEAVSVTQGKGLKKARDKQVNGEVFSEYHGNPGKISWSLAGANNYELSGVFAVIVFKAKAYVDHGNTEIKLNINRAGNSGIVDITNKITASGATFNIHRSVLNDLTFKLSSDGTGYIISSYLYADEENIIIPDEYKGMPIVGIDSAAFYNHSEIKSIKLPAYTKTIGKNAFNGCSGIENINIPDYVVEIGDSAFSDCVGLKSVSLPVGLEKIGKEAFRGCYMITDLNIPFTVSSISTGAFRNCYLLKNVKISKNTVIGLRAFENCDDSLTFSAASGCTLLETYISSAKIKAKINTIKDISLGTAEAVDEQDFTADFVEPTPAVTLKNGEKVVAGKDYRYIYRNNLNIGKATMYVEGIGGYGEGYTITFKISCKHKNATKEITKEPTCTKTGTVLVTCSLCGYRHEEIIPSEHKRDDNWIIDVRPTIYKTGEKHRICTVCKVPIDYTEVAKSYPDINNDGKVNSADALVVLRRAVAIDTSTLTVDQFMNIDTNGDGIINSIDALTILKISVGSIVL